MGTAARILRPEAGGDHNPSGFTVLAGPQPPVAIESPGCARASLRALSSPWTSQRMCA